MQIASAIDESFETRGVATMLEAEQMCMTLRGVRTPGVSTVTTKFTGTFQDDPTVQTRFLALASGRQML